MWLKLRWTILKVFLQFTAGLAPKTSKIIRRSVGDYFLTQIHEARLQRTEGDNSKYILRQLVSKGDLTETELYTLWENQSKWTEAESMFREFFLTYCEFDITLQELARTLEEIDPYEYKQILAARNFNIESFWEPQWIEKGASWFYNAYRDDICMKDEFKLFSEEGSDWSEFSKKT